MVEAAEHGLTDDPTTFWHLCFTWLGRVAIECPHSPSSHTKRKSMYNQVYGVVGSDRRTLHWYPKGPAVEPGEGQMGNVGL